MKHNSLFQLKHYGFVRVAGKDAEAFLQRQLTNDMNDVSPNTCASSAYLNPSGRVLANFLVVRRSDEYLLAASSTVLDIISKRLKMYVLRSAVEVRIASDLAMAGAFSDAANFVSETFAIESMPESPGDVVTVGDFTLFRPFGCGDRISIIAPAEQLDSVSGSNDSFEQWELRDIQNGFPLVQAETSEMFTAQAINLDLTNSVSFTKGCFPGQEILARLHYRGRTNRRVVRGVSSSNAAPAPGTAVFCDSLVGKQEGSVVNSAIDKAKGTCEMLVSVPLKFIDHKPLRVGESTDLKLLQNEMFYDIPELD